LGILLEFGYIALIAYEFVISINTITSQTIVVIIFTLFIIASLLVIYIFCFIGRIIYGAVSQDLEDAGMLLIILQKILEIDPLLFYTNSKEVKEQLKPVIHTKTITLVENEKEATFKCISLTDIDSDFVAAHKEPSSFDNTILYTKSGFAELPNDVKKIVSNSLVGDSVPNNENLFCQLIMKFLQLPSVNGLYVGKKHFKSLKLS